MISWCSLWCRLDIHHTTNGNVNQNSQKVTRLYLFYSTEKSRDGMFTRKQTRETLSDPTCAMFTCHSWHRIAGRALCWVYTKPTPPWVQVIRDYIYAWKFKYCFTLFPVKNVPQEVKENLKKAHTIFFKLNTASLGK